MTEKVLNEKEEIRNGLEVIFSYARTHIANTRPQDENEMLAIINLKARILQKMDIIADFSESILVPEALEKTEE